MPIYCIYWGTAGKKSGKMSLGPINFAKALKEKRQKQVFNLY